MAHLQSTNSDSIRQNYAVHANPDSPLVVIECAAHLARREDHQWLARQLAPNAGPKRNGRSPITRSLREPAWSRGEATRLFRIGIWLNLIQSRMVSDRNIRCRLGNQAHAHSTLEDSSMT
jgi:hypothetical protein